MSPEMKPYGSIPEIEPVQQRTPEAFMERWGAKADLTHRQLRHLWYGAQHNYVGLAAHNFDHATDSLWNAMEWADRYEAAEPEKPLIKRKLLAAALLFHDAGLHEYEAFKTRGFDSPEDLAGAIFQLYAPGANYDETETAEVHAIIGSTAENASTETAEKVIAAISDVHNLGGTYEECHRKTLLFQAEAESEQGSSFSLRKFQTGTVITLAKYLTKNLSLGGIEKPWLEQAHTNFYMMVNEFASEQKQSATAYVQSLSNKAVSHLLERISGHE